ncbi:GntR family transcriptional regulator [Nocardiopsis deserti]|uniref:GntR family transcriptional regulator n=1 Tax=Nocardiopsis deserti TaxID=2605988 RepID=UPI001238412F|nr:GntR family transcriptional regulator [Nocardiopsis deserti]
MADSANRGSTPLIGLIRQQLLSHISDEGLKEGTRLVERTLAERLRVSRSPVRRALQELEREGMVSRTDRGGYVVSGAASAPAPPAPPAYDAQSEKLYTRIAEDLLQSELPRQVTENALLRRYDVTRGQLAPVLRRISTEGWIEALPGYGWEFSPVLTSLESYRASYRFRLLVEPAAILEPGYSVDRTALLQRRREQQELVGGRVHEVSGAELFDLNSRIHETITLGSRNDFFVESLARVNRLRRLMEYRRTLVPERAVVRCREHVRLADLLLEGRLPEASEYLRQHLETVGEEKTTEP